VEKGGKPGLILASRTAHEQPPIRRREQPTTSLRGEIDMSEATSLQDLILDKLQKERRTVTVFTTNGYQMKGQIIGFDRYMVALDLQGEQAFVFKSAISTIQPVQPVDLDGLG